MSTRELAIDLIKSLSDEQLKAFINLVTVWGDRSVLAKIESNALRSDPNPKTYGSFREFMEEDEAVL